MDKYERYNAGLLKNFRKTDVVHKAITDYDRKRFKDYRNQVAKDLVIGGGTLLVGAASIHPIGRTVVGAYKGIKKAVKLAGSIGNTKKPDTVGNRLRQAQAIMGKSPKDKPFGNRTSMSTQDNKTASTKNPMLGTVIGTSASTKYYRTLTNAIEQGPSKFFSSGRSAKTGITSGKRSLTNKQISPTYNPVRSIKGERIPRRKKGADGGTSRGSLLRHNDPYSLRKYRKYAPKNFNNIPDDI